MKSGQIPWSIGFQEHRDSVLEAVLNDGSVLERIKTGGELPGGYGFRLDARICEIPWALSYVEGTRGTLLDVGSSLNHSFVVASSAIVGRSVTILTLAPEKQAFWDRGISYVFGDARDLVFKDDSFDDVVCISSLEHVGMDNARYGATDRLMGDDHLVAVREMRRVLRPGGALYLTVPFGRYRNHGWFQQFDERLLDSVIQEFEPSSLIETFFRYTPTGWVRSNRADCTDAEFFDVHEIGGPLRAARSDMPADLPAGERAVACLRLVKPLLNATDNTQVDRST